VKLATIETRATLRIHSPLTGFMRQAMWHCGDRPGLNDFDRHFIASRELITSQGFRALGEKPTISANLLAP